MHSKPSKSTIEWLNLSEAASFLGVHFTTLRRWADQGKVAHTRTPGGKRRFALADLQDFLQQNHRVAVYGSDRRTLADIGQISFQFPIGREDWMHKFGELERIKLRGTGQMMVGLLMQYTARSENNHLFLEEAQHIAGDVGVICARSGMTVKEVVTAFLLFRSTILDMILNTSAVQLPLDEEGRQLHKRTNDYMDAVLIAIISGYSEYLIS